MWFIKCSYCFITRGIPLLSREAKIRNCGWFSGAMWLTIERTKWEDLERWPCDSTANRKRTRSKTAIPPINMPSWCTCACVVCLDKVSNQHKHLELSRVFYCQVTKSKWKLQMLETKEEIVNMWRNLIQWNFIVESY